MCDQRQCSAEAQGALRTRAGPSADRCRRIRESQGLRRGAGLHVLAMRPLQPSQVHVLFVLCSSYREC